MKKYIILLLLTLSLSTAYAQESKLVKGIVYGLNNRGNKENIPYASVYRLTSQTLVECDENGSFELEYDAKDNILIATAIGFQKDTITLTEQMREVEFILKGDNQLDQSVVVAEDNANFLSKTTVARTEVISAAGLCKMACCNLAESFENSASISVGFSDAVTGARQIRMLGLSGSYTQMLDENRPIMRGIASPFGMSYVPGQWLESIQIAKGPSSVVNGLEAITGQINLEYRKPTDDVPLFVNLFLSQNLRTEVNLASSLQLNNKWSTILLGHYSTDAMAHDGNNDGFRDEPYSQQFNFANRWLYNTENGVQLRLGVKALHDTRRGGQMAFNETYMGRDSLGIDDPWGTLITNQGVNAYFKLGIPLNEDNSNNIAVVGDYTYHQMNAIYGLKNYDASQNSAFFNVIFQSMPNENHRFNFGIRNQFDMFDETLTDRWVTENNDIARNRTLLGRTESVTGLYGEYTYTLGEKLSVVADLSADYNNLHGFALAPRLNLKYSFTDWLVFRASGGRGLRSPNIVADNLGMLSTGREIVIEDNLTNEDAWTYGANLTAYLPIGHNDNTYISFDYFRSDFTKQVIVDQELRWGEINIYNLDGLSYTNTYQVDFSMEVLERLTAMVTFRYTDSKVTLRDQGLVERPLMSKYKGVLNIQYATRMNIWTFDVTAQINGPSRLPSFVEDSDGYSPVYPLVYAQVTRKLKDLDVYIGVENLLNYKQENPIINADNPYSQGFNASVIWGPLMGVKVYMGLRFTLWK